MPERLVVMEAEGPLDPQHLLSMLDTDGCGAVVSFVGLTRGTEGEEVVLRLEFDAWKDRLNAVLKRLAKEAMAEHDAVAVAMAHRTGAVEPNEPIVAIHVGTPHRKEAFTACSWLIDELKRQAPLWKKEVTTSGETWKEGLG